MSKPVGDNHCSNWRACGFCPYFHGVWEVGCQNAEGRAREDLQIKQLSVGRV